MVADELSRKLLHMSALMVKKMELIEQFIDLSLVYKLTMKSVKLGVLKVTNNVREENKEGQKFNLHLC